MRERSQTTPRRRGPKHPLPPRDIYAERRTDMYETSEPPYYSIDTTEEIYGTTLSPAQRCYVDPWDLENYDYVRKKLDSTPSPSVYYETSRSSPSPAGEPVSTNYYYRSHPQVDELDMKPRMSATMPRSHRRSANYPCELECCVPRAPLRRFEAEQTQASIYGRSGMSAGRSKYEDYMIRMTEQLHIDNEDDLEQNIYNGYGGISSASSTERHSSIGDESASTLHTHTLHTPGFGAVTNRKRSVVLPKPAPKIDFPAPPPMSPTYDLYGNPYATLPYCSVSDCYECQYATAQSIYGTSIYGGSSTLGRRPSSSLYSGIYASKFGMSKKGLLQIDYSCSWNDLDRVMGRNY